MSDFISRSRLIEEIKRYQMDIVSKATAMKVIRNAPTVTDTNVGGKWIPCSERLPENYGNVIACFSTGTVTELLYKGGGLFQGIYEYSTNVIIAWMPLPEPYKGEQHEIN